ncbi:MAG: OmpA family protein [Candidatus Thiothrix sulfatifontis]|nr:MAG: OmpA family protein [Candidatus Thiothrix sulfatifontis]
MLDSTADNDDLTPLQEYVIAGVVILLFGLLYWFLNHGDSDEAALMAANTSTPQVVMLAAPQTPVATATAEVNDANVAPDAKKTDGGSATLSAKTAPAPLQNTPVSVPDISATPAVTTPTAATLEAGPVGSASANAGLAFRDAIIQRELNKPIIFDEIKFDSGSSKPNNQSSTQIQQVVALLHANPDIKLLIRGHTDEVGTAKNNTELSLIRANEVGVALVQAISLYTSP